MPTNSAKTHLIMYKADTSSDIFIDSSILARLILNIREGLSDCRDVYSPEEVSN